ncbi:protein kinase [Hamiltosporidium tvaerminnensis]|uniref:Protein kinase n=1 Tax=Hamiltosporidium tvaerminnensis TaxID=1176355 RepID=A0A4Q9KXS2_9MICR|nr:hypothetical protein LUQ84_002730 [Hamiltosporidium tvaerminnensis]TBT99758.1 protein kinase [Hamiltosporidium tvaerminnensis]
MRIIKFSMIFLHQLCFGTLLYESRKENSIPMSKNCYEKNFESQIEMLGFENVEFVAEGEHGYVFGAIDSINGKKQAIKVSKSKPSIENEINMLSGLEHSNIIKLLNVKKQNSTIFIFYDFYEKTLYKFVDKNKINQRKKKIIIKQLLDVLVYLNEKQIIHNDLNPNNIMIQNSYTVRVIDFGISCSKESPKNLFMSNLSEEDNKKYFHYSPEVRDLAQTFDEKTDIWSLGCVIYFIETKKKLTEYILEENLQEKYRKFISYFIHKDPSYRISAEIARMSDFFDDIYKQMFCFCCLRSKIYFLNEIEYRIENDILLFEREEFHYQIHCKHTIESIILYQEKLSVIRRNNQDFIKQNPNFEFSKKCKFLVYLNQTKYMLYELPIEHFCVVWQAFRLLKDQNISTGLKKHVF